MTAPITLGTLTKPQPNFVSVNAQNEALVATTGKTIHELMAEAVEHERQRMLSGGDTKQYVKLLTTVFGKFSIGAPVHVINEEATPQLTRDEIKQRIDNHMTRIALGKKSVPEPAKE